MRTSDVDYRTLWWWPRSRASVRSSMGWRSRSSRSARRRCSCPRKSCPPSLSSARPERAGADATLITRRSAPSCAFATLLSITRSSSVMTRTSRASDWRNGDGGLPVVVPVRWRLFSTPVTSASGSRYAPRLIVTSPLRRFAGAPSFDRCRQLQRAVDFGPQPFREVHGHPGHVRRELSLKFRRVLDLPRPAQLAAVDGAAQRRDERVASRQHRHRVELAGHDSRLSKAKLAVGKTDVAIDRRLGQRAR